MCTVKVVIIGNSGVGKMSLRGQVRTINWLFIRVSLWCEQYVSGHFLTGFHSTIGTDFITKTLPHHSKPDESVTLQIWGHTRPSTRSPFASTPHPPRGRRIPPGKNASRPFLPHTSAARMLSSSSSTSISPRRCALLTTGGQSFARAHPSATTKRRITVS